ncbi:hypothetical protein [Microvirga roseola]|uniref:hypothetical protein n=1 Tax=Microvirga roseola TaxID=2883126 RepID=UPI001E51E0B7|nr:hypothetical protein [Microvirga roseola]
MKQIAWVLAGATGALLLGAPALAQDKMKRGEYLVSIMDCAGCHTPGTLLGKPDMHRRL